MPGTLLPISQAWLYFIHQQFYELAMIILISQMRKSRLREVNQVAKVTQPVHCRVGICTQSLCLLLAVSFGASYLTCVPAFSSIK